MKKSLIFIPWLILLIAGCKKDDDDDTTANPPLSDTPFIEFKSVNKTTVQQFTDSLVFIIFFQDGDGDIGFEDADSIALNLVDNRVPLTHSYHLPPFAPTGADLSVQGSLNVVLQNTILIDQNSSSETATFTLQLRDRAGNWSNEVSSPTITITQ